jgi:hypothetical protein
MGRPQPNYGSSTRAVEKLKFRERTPLISIGHRENAVLAFSQALPFKVQLEASQQRSIKLDNAVGSGAWKRLE